MPGTSTVNSNGGSGIGIQSNESFEQAVPPMRHLPRRAKAECLCVRKDQTTIWTKWKGRSDRTQRCWYLVVKRSRKRCSKPENEVSMGKSRTSVASPASEPMSDENLGMDSKGNQSESGIRTERTPEIFVLSESSSKVRTSLLRPREERVVVHKNLGTGVTIDDFPESDDSNHTGSSGSFSRSELHSSGNWSPLMELVDELVVVLDGETKKIRAHNSKLAKYLGFMPKELEGKSWLDIIHTDSIQPSYECFEKLRAMTLPHVDLDFTNIVTDKPLQVLPLNANQCTKLGQVKKVVWKATLDQKEGSIVLVGKDFELEDESSTKLLFFDMSRDGMAVSDANTKRFVYCNQALANTLGYTVEELASRPVSEFVLEDDAERTLAWFGGNSTTPVPVNMESRFICKDGAIKTLSWSGFLDPQTNRAYATSRDITNLKRIQEQLQVANTAKSRFLASVSHEMRTPLNGIEGTAQMLLIEIQSQRAGSPQALASSHKEQIETILICSSHLLNIVNDLLDLSSIQAGKMLLNKGTCVLQTCIEDAFRVNATLLHNRSGLKCRWRIADDVPKAILADGVRLRQMLSNLINNAIKFTPAGSIELSVRKVTPTSSCELSLEFAVRDTGIGIPTEMQANLFEAFTQISSLDGTRPSGTGLGLAITNRLARLMGGQLSLESVFGQGSTFKFTIETRATSSPPLLSPCLYSHHDTLAQRCPQRILCAEDNALNVKILRRMLHKMGYADSDIAFTSNGLELLEYFRDPQSIRDGKHRSGEQQTKGKEIAELDNKNNAELEEKEGKRWDVVLMDIHMPEMGGLEACERLLTWHKETQMAPPYVIAVTASAMNEDREQCIRAGMRGFIAKPIQMADLVTQLENAYFEVHGSPQRQAGASSSMPSTTCRVTTSRSTSNESSTADASSSDSEDSESGGSEGYAEF